jgi:tetratricopeptide (TPR) repeat protein
VPTARRGARRLGPGLLLVGCRGESYRRAVHAAETIVGRQTELASLDEFLARLEDGPRGLFLEGEAGIGKTRLWRAGIEVAQQHEFTVLSTRPGETEAKLGFAGLADLLGAVVGELLPELPPPQRRALQVALLLAETDTLPPDDRAVAAAFLGSLRLLAAAGPVLVAVDDVQWLDGASARALEFACRRLHDEPVGILAAVRVAPEGVEPHELIRALGDERVERLLVGPLTVAALYELVGAQLDLALSRFALLRIHETSGGNPFFALELARALQRSGVEPVPGEALPVTPTLRELVRARLALLPRSASETLLPAAALSRPTVALVERAVGSQRVDRDLESAVQAGVIELRGDVISFTHPLLASIPFADASPRVRRDVHQRLAAVVADPEERARHLALAAEGPDAAVAAALEDAAARACSRGAVAAGAELAEQAFRLTPTELAIEAHRRVLVAAEQHYSAGNTARAVELLEGALEAVPSGSTRAELLWSIGKIKFEGQDTRVGHDFCRRALREAGADEQLRARILVSVAYQSSKRGSFADAQADAREAVALAERLGDTPMLARAVTAVAHLKSLCGEALDTDLYERGMVLEEELGGLELDYGPTAVYARDLNDAGEFDRARPLLEQLCERGRASGDAAVNLALCVLADLEFSTGHWERAAALATESHDVAVQTGREAAEPRGLF